MESLPGNYEKESEKGYEKKKQTALIAAAIFNLPDVCRLFQPGSE